MSVKNKIVGGVFWTALEIIINRGFGLLVQLILARILFPSDYGLVGMATVSIAFINVFNDLGMNAALVQKKVNKLSPAHFDTVFWTGVFWSVLLYVIIFFIGAPLTSTFYNEPELKKIIPVISLSLLISPINSVHKAKLVKSLEFKKLAIISNISSIISGIVGLVLAYIGFGVWALIFNSIAGALISVPLYFKATKWLPRFIWEKRAFDETFGFGVYTTGTSLFNYLIGNIDYLMIGKLLGTLVLGYYTFAFTITNMIRDQIVAIINKVAYPVYASIQDDKKKMKDIFLKIVSINNLAVYPVVIGLFLFGEYIIPMFFGHKWDKSLPLIRILSIAVLIQMLNNSHTMLFRAAGKVKLEFRLQLLKSLCFYIPLIATGAYLYGVEGAAIGFTISIFLGVAVSFYFMKLIFELRILESLKVLKGSLLLFVISVPIIEFLKTIIDWTICIPIYFVIVGLIYWYSAKLQIQMLLDILKNSRKIIK